MFESKTCRDSLKHQMAANGGFYRGVFAGPEGVFSQLFHGSCSVVLQCPVLFSGRFFGQVEIGSRVAEFDFEACSFEGAWDVSLNFAGKMEEDSIY